MGRRITPIHHRKLRKIFELDGWEFVRQKGSHIELQKEGAERPVVVPRYKDITVRIIESNMKTAKMSRERYFELLDKV